MAEPLMIDGWEDCSTGGGFNALAKQLPNGLYWLMTNDDNQSPTQWDEPVCLQLLDQGAPVDGHDAHLCDTVGEALTIVGAYVSPPAPTATALLVDALDRYLDYLTVNGYAHLYTRTRALREALHNAPVDRHPIIRPDGRIVFVSIPDNEDK